MQEYKEIRRTPRGNRRVPNKALVLDANILIRAILGQRVRRTLELHAKRVSFFIPETTSPEAEHHFGV
jgi:hypothetical protein